MVSGMPRSLRRFVLPMTLALCAGLAATAASAPVTDEFTYQGELMTAGTPASGPHDFRFRLYDAQVGGAQIGAQILRTANVTNGRFTTSLQFPGAFTGTALWLEIDARPSGGGAYTTLGPRQALTAAPNAAYAINAGTANNAALLGGNNSAFFTNASNLTSGTLPTGRLSGGYSSALNLSNAGNVFVGNGAGLTGLNATSIGSGTLPDARLSANVALRNAVNTFSGTENIFNTEVGIGGTPLYPLHVIDDGGSAIKVDNLGAGAITYGVNVDIEGTSSRYAYYADVNGLTGSGYAFYAANESASGRGLYALMSGTGTTYGVYVSNNSPTGYGGYFNNTSLTGTTYGLRCENNSADGYGLYALHDASTGTGPAIYGRTDSTSGSAYAIHGIVQSTAPGGSSAGIRGENNGTGALGIGVYGSHDGSGWGVYGFAAGAGRGVYGYSTSGIGGYFDTGVSGGDALYVVGTASVGVITIRGGADVAENFEAVTDAAEIVPGMVVMIDDEHVGGVELARGAYNKRVAGVVSGGNELAAGMVLGQFDGLKDPKPVALSGRVWTFVDATDAAVLPGDLLTTSDTPGYAMPVIDAGKAHGATIGKAMSGLGKGEKGMVLVLVNLQ